jgi:hypothetical protein
MGLKRESLKRVEGVGYYTSYGSDANDVLGYIESDVQDRLEEDPPYNSYDKTFKVTIIVEEI